MSVKGFHYSTLQRFNEEYYAGLLSQANLKEEIAIGPKGEERLFWVLEKGKTKYLMDSEAIANLPVKIKSTEVVTYKGKVFHHLSEVCSVKYLSEKDMGFRDLIEALAPFEHDNPTHFILYKIMAVVAYISRVNIRVASNPSFGKDSIFSILNALRNDVPIVNPHSMAAIDYRLTNNTLVLTEISNLKKEQRRLLQEFLLIAGDMKNVYEKSTRGVSGYGTQDTYDISHLSIVLNYNTLAEYESSGQDGEYFDYKFQDAVLDRFCPFKLEGKLDIKQFTKSLINTGKEVNEHKDTYVGIIHTLEWLINNFENVDHVFEITDKNMSIQGRHWSSFQKIVKGIGLYSKTPTEFDGLVGELYKAYKEYLKMVGQESVTLDQYSKEENTQGFNLFNEEEIVEDMRPPKEDKSVLYWLEMNMPMTYDTAWDKIRDELKVDEDTFRGFYEQYTIEKYG